MLSSQPIKTYIAPADDSADNQIDMSWGWFNGKTVYKSSLISYAMNARAFARKRGSIYKYFEQNGYGGGFQRIGGISDVLSNTLFVHEKNMVTGPITPVYSQYAFTNDPASTGYVGGASTWANTDVVPRLVPISGYNCYDGTENGNPYGDTEPYCTQTLNGVTAEFFQTPRPRRPRAAPARSKTGSTFTRSRPPACSV